MTAPLTPLQQDLTQVRGTWDRSGFRSLSQPTGLRWVASDARHRNRLAHHLAATRHHLARMRPADLRSGWIARCRAEQLEALYAEGAGICQACGRAAPLIGGECPECRH